MICRGSESGGIHDDIGAKSRFLDQYGIASFKGFCYLPQGNAISLPIDTNVM